MKGLIKMKPGDRLPSRVFQLKDAGGTAANVSTAISVRARLTLENGEEILRAVTVLNAAQGIVQYDFQGDELRDGEITLLDFVVEYGGALPLSYPDDDWWGIVSVVSRARA